MKMKKLIALALSALLLMSMFAGCVANEPTTPGTNTYNINTVEAGYLTVITSPDYAPYEFYVVKDNGEYQLAGFDMALAQYIADYLGLTLKVVPMSFDGIIMEMAAGKADLAIAGLSPDPDRAGTIDFSDIYYGGKQAFVTTKEKAAQFTDLASTNNSAYTIAAQTGTIQNDLAAQYSPNANLINLEAATSIVAELSQNLIDGAYIEWDVAVAYQAQYPNLQILCEVPYTDDGNIIGVAKGNADLLKYVNEALNKCISDGTFAQFVDTALKQAAGDTYEGLLPSESADEK